MLKKLRTVIYHVDDLDKAKAWYKNITGIDPYFDESFYVGFDINGCELGLDPDFTRIESGNQSIAYWSVDDIENVVATLTANNAAIMSPVTGVGEGIKAAVLKDPFGNALGLIEEAV
jgi:predicted enzyme related to lactoylglutathione lyase